VLDNNLSIDNDIIILDKDMIDNISILLDNVSMLDNIYSYQHIITRQKQNIPLWLTIQFL
jgi:hypothetical protein